jgi:hypothetical protein
MVKITLESKKPEIEITVGDDYIFPFWRNKIPTLKTFKNY